MLQKWSLRLMVSLVILGLGATQAQAQAGEFGFKLGGAMSSLSDLDDTDDIGSGTGLSGGVFVNVGSTVRGQFELLYTDRKVTSTTEGDDSSISEKFIDIPLFLAVKPGTGPVRIKLYVGPQLSIKTSCKISDGTTTLDCTTQSLAANSTMFSAVGGAALDIALGGVFLEIDARYGLGLTNVIDEVDDTSKCRTFQVFAGLGIPFGPQPGQ